MAGSWRSSFAIAGLWRGDVLTAVSGIATPNSACVELSQPTREVPQGLAVCSRGYASGTRAFLDNLSNLRRWCLCGRAHQLPHRTLVLPTRATTRRQRGLSGCGQPEGELPKRQKEADDQQQSAEPAPSTSLLLLSICLQPVHTFARAPLRSSRRSRVQKEDTGPFQAGA